MIRIYDLQIKGFRGVNAGHIFFGNTTVLVGPNNSGKTTVVEALALLFGRDRLIRSLTEHDFFGSTPKESDRIKLIATIVGFHKNDPQHNPQWFSANRAVIKWLRPETGELSATYTRGAELACQIAFCARFDLDSLEAEVVRYFHDDDAEPDPFKEGHTNTVPASLIRELGFFLIPSSRTWDRMVSFGSELFRRVLGVVGGPPAKAIIDLRNELRNPKEPLETDGNLKGLVDEVNMETRKLFPRAPELKLRITATDSESVLEAVTPHYEIAGSPALPAKRMGSGLTALQSLFLLLQFGKLRIKAGNAFVVAFEEPELHIPPPVQRRVINRIRGLASQVVATTHSPTVASMCEPENVWLLRNTVGGGLLANRVRSDASDPADENWKRVIFSQRREELINALMHEVVLVPEGRFDREWLAKLASAIEIEAGRSDTEFPAFGALIGTIPTPDSNVCNVTSEMVRVHGRVVCLVDGDEQGDIYAAQLAKLAPPPGRVLQWPTGWEIEHAIGWVLEADEAGSLSRLNTELPISCSRISDFVARLGLRNKDGGFKDNAAVHDIVVEAIVTNRETLRRAGDLLECLVRGAIEASPAEYWVKQASPTSVEIVRFAPCR